LPSRDAAGSQDKSAHSHQDLPLLHALALGAVQGPTEVLPISSSGHIAVLPWFLGWQYPLLDPPLRKSFEVGLHGGGGLALAIVLREEIEQLLEGPWPRTGALLALALAPSVLLGYRLERPIEARLGTPRTVAWGLIAGGLALGWADRAPGRRGWREACARDALWLGLAQACALFPGISRGGATLAAARFRGFARSDAHHLSRQMALPVIAGAGALKARRLRADGLPAGLRAPFLVGVVSSFASTLASRPLLRRGDGERPLAPFAAYRIGLAAAVLLRLRRTR
jgi:undecaprenyl-diphosphatase